MEKEDIQDWIALRLAPGVGNALYKRLLERFGSPGRVLAASVSDLATVEGMTEKAVRGIKDPSLSSGAAQEVLRVHEEGASLVTLSDPLYPSQLAAIYDPPPVLYVKGTLEMTDRRAIAIVGSRKATGYGVLMAEKLGCELAARGFTIVSGMARGIDGAAHRGALEANGRTVAVLGCGIDVVYPREHHDLRERIITAGAVLTDFPMGTPPDTGNFPQRNRIISGLSVGVVIVEAGLRSGSLITARLALEQGREVFAVPGNVGAKYSSGTNRLIKQGAKLVETADDILEELTPQLEESPVRASVEGTPDDGEGEDSSAGAEKTWHGLSSEEEAVMEVLTTEPQHVEALLAATRLPVQTLSTALLTLELKGAVRQTAGQLYMKR